MSRKSIIIVVVTTMAVCCVGALNPSIALAQGGSGGGTHGTRHGVFPANHSGPGPDHFSRRLYRPGTRNGNSDSGIAAMDRAANLTDVLTYYQNLVANGARASPRRRLSAHR
jgi:hypothetical protein